MPISEADERLVSLIALLDLTTAFGTLAHSILLERLKVTFGGCVVALGCFASSVRYRSRSVSVDRIVSAPSPFVYGGPQGSVLGPVLRRLYSQLPLEVISDHDCDFHKYGNDMELRKSTPSDKFCPLHVNSTDDVLSWVNSMLNTDKKEVLAVNASSRLRLVDKDWADIVGSNILFKISLK